MSRIGSSSFNPSVDTDATEPESGVADPASQSEGWFDKIADAFESVVDHFSDGQEVFASPSAKEKERQAYNTQVNVSEKTDIQVDGYHYDDVKQGQIGDCYLMSSIAALAEREPAAIDRMIKDEKYGADGNLESATVTLHVKNWLGQLEAKDVKVDCRQFSAHRANFGDTDKSGKQELWPVVIEKAYAQLNSDSYHGIGRGGSAASAMETLTGKSSRTVGVGDYSFEKMDADLRSGKLVVLTTSKVKDADGNVIDGKKKLQQGLEGQNLYGNHAYTVLDSKVDESGQKMVKIYNPWGSNHPGSADATGGWMKYEDAQKLFNQASVNG